MYVFFLGLNWWIEELVSCELFIIFLFIVILVWFVWWWIYWYWILKIPPLQNTIGCIICFSRMVISMNNFVYDWLLFFLKWTCFYLWFDWLKCQNIIMKWFNNLVLINDGFNFTYFTFSLITKDYTLMSIKW